MNDIAEKEHKKAPKIKENHETKIQKKSKDETEAGKVDHKEPGDESNKNSNSRQKGTALGQFINKKFLKISFEVDVICAFLFIMGLVTRMYKLGQPRNVVFDELHYGKYVSLYMKNIFFFDSHPPLGKQLIAGVAHLTNYDGKFKFDKIGSPYPSEVPLVALRLVPAIFGSLIIPTSYHLMNELGLSQWTSLIASLLLLLDNAILTQSRFILMESMVIFFSLFGILCILKFRKHNHQPYSISWFTWLIIGSVSLTCALSVKYAGVYSCCLGLAILARDFWTLLSSDLSNKALLVRFLSQLAVVTVIPLALYLGIFYIHLSVLYKAGPHDNIMTSAFQASLEGGLASITKGQPSFIAHGSQITLRHTHGRTCWLHSHNHVYPIRYPDGRGSSHQQQVTCYSFKDVNNWWIVKRPEKSDLVVDHNIDAIKHGDVIQLVHGITSRALNSHDVAAAMSPQSQEVSCYVDYNVSMSAQNLWRVEVLNPESAEGPASWQAIQSLIRLVHVDTGAALKYSGRQMPDWGFHQHEVVADRIVQQDDTVWNVEEHRYTKSEDQKERERDLVSAEMIPMTATSLTFWEKLLELHYKMLFVGTESVQNHMYSSEPLEWPLMARGIAYWVSSTSNAQIHLLGNIAIWYSGTCGLFIYISLLIFYLLRRRRQLYDLREEVWDKFRTIGEVILTGYFFHFVPYFFGERTLFLHHYLQAFTFKCFLIAFVLEHVYFLIEDVIKSRWLVYVYIPCVFLWLGYITYVFYKFSVLSYGTVDLSKNDIVNLRWKDTWDFIVHKS